MNNSISNNINKLLSEIPDYVKIVAVSKSKSIELINKAYNSGHRSFGENKIQEMVRKCESLPNDIEWHMIGHVQRNKVKYMASFVSLIHGVDSQKLLIEINKQAKRYNRIIKCLLQVHISKEKSKFGLNRNNLDSIIEFSKSLNNIDVCGLMGMATFTDDLSIIDDEFKSLKNLYDLYKTNNNFSILSMGMSNDYSIAINNGSNMIRIGSKIFGNRI